jgi:hypothetical protein
MSDMRKLKIAIHRGTTDYGGEVGDPSGIIEVQLLLGSNPELVKDAVSMLKVRIKERSQITSSLALDLLNQCMQYNGIHFQLCVMEKVLNRILKLALPHKGNHPRIQQKAFHLIKKWSSAYSNDPCLNEFVLAGKELAKRRDRTKAAQLSSRSAPSSSSASASKATTPTVSATLGDGVIYLARYESPPRAHIPTVRAHAQRPLFTAPA